MYSEDEKTHKFPMVSLLNTLFQDDPSRTLFERSLVIEIHETYFEVDKKAPDPNTPVQKERFMCRSTVSILNALKYAKESVYMVYLHDAKKKVKAKMFLSNFSLKCHYSFIDLYIKS